MENHSSKFRVDHISASKLSWEPDQSISKTYNQAGTVSSISSFETNFRSWQRHFLQFIRFITNKTILEPLLRFQHNLYVNINIFPDLFMVPKARAQAGGPYLIKTLPKIKNPVAIFRFGWIIALFSLSYASKEIGCVLFTYLFNILIRWERRML